LKILFASFAFWFVSLIHVALHCLLASPCASDSDLTFFWLQCKREGFLKKIDEEKGEGCNIYGTLMVNKVAGNFHFVPGKSFHISDFIGDLIMLEQPMYNVRS